MASCVVGLCKMDALIVTSINPWSRLEAQLECYQAWKELGYRVKTYNCSEEYERLVRAGVSRQDLVEIDEAKTSKHINGKPIPRIMPVLEDACNIGSDNIILVNSDIYPAQRKKVTGFLASLSGAMALTRKECVAYPDALHTDRYHYRKGLDIFFFTNEALKRIYARLLKSDVSQRMTFGVPGWDFFLGHQILCDPEGAILDGEAFLHAVHPTTYHDASEFSHYAAEMAKSPMYGTVEGHNIEQKFVKLIDLNCERNAKASQALRSAYYQNVQESENSGYALAKTVQREFYGALARHNIEAPNDSKSLRLFISAQLERPNWEAAQFYAMHRMAALSAIDKSLMLLLLLLIVMRATGLKTEKDNYPKGNMHVPAVREILGRHEEGLPRFMSILSLFANEAINHSIFNTTLFKYIIVSTENPRSLNLCIAIEDYCSKRLV